MAGPVFTMQCSAAWPSFCYRFICWNTIYGLRSRVPGNRRTTISQVLPRWLSPRRWHGRPARENTRKMRVPLKIWSANTFRLVVYILGINAYHGDAAAALVKDGELIAAVEEERFNRIKHCAGFPAQSIEYCLRTAGITIEEVEHVGISRNPAAHLHKKILTGARRAIIGRRSAPAHARPKASLRLAGGAHSRPLQEGPLGKPNEGDPPNL